MTWRKILKKIRLYSIQDWFSILYQKIIFDGIIGNFDTFFFKFKCFTWGVNLGYNSKCFGKVIIIRAPQSDIIIGNNCLLVSSSKRSTASSIYAPTKLRTFSSSAKIIIKDSVDLNGCSISCRSKLIEIGEGTMIAPNCTIMDSDFHALWPPEERRSNPAFERDKSVIIGKNVWIGSQSVILKGVKIGDNSIIGARSVVTKDVPENSLAVGNPARIIKKLDN